MMFVLLLPAIIMGFVPAYQPQSPWLGAYPQSNRLMAVHVEPQLYLVSGGNRVYIPPPSVGSYGHRHSSNRLSRPYQYGEEFEDLYPFGFGFAANQPSRTTTGTGAGFMPFFLEPEDRKQYEMYKRGIVTPDFDAAEIAQYNAMAQAEGITIPSSAGGASTSAQTSSGTSSTTTTTTDSSGTTTSTSSGESTSGESSGTATSTSSTTPQFSNPFGGWFPFMGMDSEDIAQYGMYRNGIYSPDMDASEIAQYQMFDQYQGNAAPTFRGGYGRRKL